MSVEYTLDPQDIASARLLALGIRPKIELTLFTGAVCVLLALSTTPWPIGSMPLLIGLTASLGAFRLIQINRVREAATAAFHRNRTLRQLTAASWDDAGITIRPDGSQSELITWTQLQPLRENERVILLLQKSGAIHAIPKRAFPDKAALAAFKRLARAARV